MLYRNNDAGLLEVITSGSMFAGKTKTLLTRLETFQLAGKNTVVFCPKGSQIRYTTKSEVVSHDGKRMRAFQVTSSQDIQQCFEGMTPKTAKVDVIGIDEVMLFDDGIVNVIEDLVKRNFIVIVAGLSMTSEGEPFGPMPQLLAMADIITKVYGVCQKCGNPSTRSWPLFNKKERVALGAQYIALCRQCWYQMKEEDRKE